MHRGAAAVVFLALALGQTWLHQDPPTAQCPHGAPRTATLPGSAASPIFLGARSSLLLPSSRTPKTLLHPGSIQADFRCPSCCAHSAGAWHSHRRDPDIDTVPGGGGGRMEVGEGHPRRLVLPTGVRSCHQD